MKAQRAHAASAAQPAAAPSAAEVEALRAEVARLKGRLAEAEALADRDPLAPVLNRRAFVRELGRAASFVERYGGRASLVYFDLDRFKAVNDRFGHAAGDAALRHVAGLMAGAVRETDSVGRLGGDEFGLILIQADADAARAKAESLTRLSAERPFAWEGETPPLALSYGVAEIGAGEPAEAALARADAAMYAARARRAAG